MTQPALPQLVATSLRGPVATVVRVPGDKSISHRALLFGALTPGKTVISNLNMGTAVTLLADALPRLGVRIQTFAHGTASVEGLARGEAPKAGFHLNFGPSSAAARLTLGALAGLGAHGVIDGDETLRARPMDFVVDPLRALGAQLDYAGEPGRLPIKLNGGTVRDGSVELRVGSAQATSAVLLAAATAQSNVKIGLRVRSRDHTERLLAHLGCPVQLEGSAYLFQSRPLGELPYLAVPGDPSLAAYLAAAHVLRADGSSLRIADVCLNPSRLGLFECLRRMGASVVEEVVGTLFGEPVGNLVVSASSALRPLHVSGQELVHSMIDEIPLLAALMTRAQGTSTIRDAHELVFKETNRLETSAAMLGQFGAEVEVVEGGLRVSGGGELLPGLVDGMNDHRIAMSAAVLGTAITGRTSVEGGLCCDTSFPGFAECMQSAGFDVRRKSLVAVEQPRGALCG